MQVPKVNTVLFGLGDWGKILKKNLQKNTNLIFTFNSKNKISEFNFDIIDWAIVATTNETHYKIVKFLLNKRVNVFCEKPLTLSYKSSKELIELSKKNKVKLYIDHIYEFKSLGFNLKKNNLIKRSKISKKDFYDILYDLTYHDLYIINSKVQFKNSKIKYIEYSSSKLCFELSMNNYNYKFIYNLNQKKLHSINQKSLIDKKNYINKMFQEVFYGKLNFNKNHIDALFCNKMIEKISLFYKKRLG